MRVKIELWVVKVKRCQFRILRIGFGVFGTLRVVNKNRQPSQNIRLDLEQIIRMYPNYIGSLVYGLIVRDDSLTFMRLISLR